MALVGSIIILLLAPGLHSLCSRSPRLLKWVRLATSVAIVLLVAGHLLPDSVEMVGAAALAAAAAGFALVCIPEHFSGMNKGAPYRLGVALGVIGLSAHALLDGWALSPGAHAHGHHEHALGWAVLVHRLPMGLFLWGALSPRSRTLAWLALWLICLGTVVGYVGGHSLVHFRPVGSTLALLQALVGGSLLHTVLDPILHRRSHAAPKTG